jgi:DNA-binding response OmpR family regulator
MPQQETAVVERQAHILVVDDDPAFLLILRSALEAEGYHVEVALNGYDAAVIFAQRLAGRPALMVTDLRLPLQDGWDFIRAFRTQYDAVPVIVITATSDQIPPDLTHDIAALIRKPFDLNGFLSTVRMYLPGSTPLQPTA